VSIAAIGKSYPDDRKDKEKENASRKKAGECKQSTVVYMSGEVTYIVDMLMS